MKMSAPKFCVTGSQASVQTKLRPKCWMAGQARSKTFQAMSPRRTVAARAEMTAIPLKRMSPSRMPRRRRSVSGAAAGSNVVEVNATNPTRLRLDLLELAVDEPVDRLRERDEEERRTVLLPRGDGPVHELPQRLRLVPGLRRDDHVREGGDRIRLLAALLGRIDDLELLESSNLRRHVAERRRHAADARCREAACPVLDQRELVLVLNRVRGVH